MINPEYLQVINDHLFGVYYFDGDQLMADWNGRRKGTEKYKPNIQEIEESWLWILLRWFLRDHYFNPFTERWEALDYPDQEWDQLVKYGKSKLARD